MKSSWCRRQAHHLLHHAGVDRCGRRGHLSQPRLSHLRVDDQLSCGGKAVPSSCTRSATSRWMCASLKSLITDRTKLIILNSPQNPNRRHPAARRTSNRWLAPLANATSWCSPTRSTAVCSLRASRSPSCPFRHEGTDDPLDGFSKTYANDWLAHGLRRDARELAAQITRLMTNSNSCTASFTQVAGIEALRGDQSAVGRMCAEFQHRSQVFVDGLNKIKGSVAALPKGAFYVFPNITAQDGNRSHGRRAAGTNRLAALSGAAFGQYGEGYLRFSVANSLKISKKRWSASTAGQRRISVFLMRVLAQTPGAPPSPRFCFCG